MTKLSFFELLFPLVCTRPGYQGYYSLVRHRKTCDVGLLSVCIFIDVNATVWKGRKGQKLQSGLLFRSLRTLVDPSCCVPIVTLVAAQTD